MKVLIKMLVTLSLVAALSGLLLSYVASLTESQIEENQKRAISQAIYRLIPRAKKSRLKTLANYEVYFVYDNRDSLLGYSLLTSGNGYQGRIKILIGLARDFKTLEGIEILENVETPGLGGKVSSPEFLKQFRGITVFPELIYVKNKKPALDNEIEAITGATISSAGVVKTINSTIKETVPLIKGYER